MLKHKTIGINFVAHLLLQVLSLWHLWSLSISLIQHLFSFLSLRHVSICLFLTSGRSSSSPHPIIPPLFTIWAWLCCVMVVHWLTYSLPSSPSPPLHSEHTLSLSGRSALHWACSVNHLSLTRTLIRYGAAVDLQDNKVSFDSGQLLYLLFLWVS